MIAYCPSQNWPGATSKRKRPPGGGDPAAGVGRQAVARPLAQGYGERLLHRIFGDVDVTEGADQGSH
jgi:hypothetical protein